MGAKRKSSHASNEKTGSELESNESIQLDLLDIYFALHAGAIDKSAPDRRMVCFVPMSAQKVRKVLPVRDQNQGSV